MNKRKYRLICYASAIGLLLGGCNIISDIDRDASADVYDKFVIPGTEVETLQGEVPFANFTLPQMGDTTEENTTFETTWSMIDSTEESTETIPTTEAPTVVPPELTLPNPDNAGTVIVIDPGHGGEFLGAVYNGFREKDLSLVVGIRIREYLLANYQNVAVYLTRDIDKHFSIDQKNDLEQRVEYAHSLNANALVSIHFNSDGGMHSSEGSLVCVSKQPAVLEQSAGLANSILNQLSYLGLKNQGLLYRDSDTYIDSNGIPEDYYAINRYAASVGMVGIIVEHAFMDNPAQVPFFNSPEAWEALARADAIGIAEFYGLQAK